MADEIISTRIVANADFSSLIADVHRVTASLSKLQEQLANSNKMLANNVAVINRNFSDTLRSTGQFSTHFVSLNSDVEKFGKNLDSGRLKLRDYFNTYQQHAKTTGGLIRQLAQQQVAMQNSVLQPLGRNAQGLMQFNVHVPRGLDTIKNKTALASQELKIMNKVIQDGAVQLINWGKNTQWAGRQLTVGLTLPLAAFGKSAADAFKVADQELTRLTKVYGGVAATSAAELKKIRTEVAATAAQLAKEYGASFQETISLAADIAATGKQGNELLASVSETTRLSVLGEVDRQEAMKATLALQSAFKSNTEELTQSINFLNAVENQTSTTLNDLVEAIPKAGPVIKGLGGSVKDLALYLTAMREGGISASEGANALKSGLASLINPTDKAVAQFKGFGIDLLGIVNNNAGNVTQTLLDLQSALDKLNPLQKQQAIENLFGKFQFARMNALFENLGKQGSQTLQVLDLMKASTADLANIAGRELTAVTESASGKYRRAIESLRADLAGVGEEFLTIGTKVINIVDKALQFFNNLPKPVKTALTFIGALTALAGPLIMLTGLLANFFGYILKGVMHMKAFFKGGEGWKYLTPEMMAAEKAGKLVEQTFYSDAKAASILQLALKNLIDEFSILEAKAKSGAISAQPMISTISGSVIMPGGGARVVNPKHPLAGEYGSRASTHMVPRGSMTEEQKLQQTIFGLVPGSQPVNRKIGQNPQIYMNEGLPNVPGLTTVSGVSTGVVAGEAARWHAMMGTLAMQSKEEIAQLKKTIATTGIVNKEFMQQFDQVLPAVSAITDNAARESALIVGQLRAGKITLDQAKKQIVELNLQIERMIAETVGAQATSMGRTINPTIVPTLNQPVVDATGKSNMRELFKKGKTKDLINKIAKSVGVRTSGAGYNIETTIPKKFADGGTVVPGPRSDRTDTQYMELNAGDFVLNRRASDNLLGFNNGGIVPAMVTPGEIVIHNPGPDEIPALEAYNNRFAMGGRVTARKNNYGQQMTTAQAMQLIRKTTQFHENPNYNENMKIAAITSDASILHGMGMNPEQAIQMAMMDYEDAISYATSPYTGNFSLKAFTRRRTEQLKRIQKNAPRLGLSAKPIYGGTGRQSSFTRFDKGISNIQKMIMESDKFSKGSKEYLSALGLQAPKGQRTWVRGHYQRMGGLDLQGLGYLYQAAPIPSEINSFWATTENKRLGQDLLIPVAEGRGGARSLFQRTIERAAQRGGYNRQQTPTPRDVLASSRNASPLQRMLQKALSASYATRVPVLRNSGGIIPGYAMGGIVGMNKNNYGIQSLGMPLSIKNRLMAEKIGARVSSSRFRNVKPIDYGHLVKETSGHSFPVKGVGGIYKNPDGEGFVFVKPMMDETAALAELRATEIARRAHGLNSPRQTIRVMKDPTDVSGKRKFVVLQSPYDPNLAAGGNKFTRRDFVKQLVASLVRGDKDLSSANVFGPNLADVGTAGVFSRASGSRSFNFNMPSMSDQAMINLLGVKGGAKRAFAESTSDIARKMTPDAYHNAIIKEINSVLPKMKETVNSFKLTRMERKVYERMIKRLEDGLHTDWRPYQGIHANVKPKKFALGGMVTKGTSNYGRPSYGSQFSKAFKKSSKPTKPGQFDPNSGMMASMAGFGVMMAGQAINNPIGQGMQMAGMAMQMYPMIKMIGNASKGFMTLTGTVTKFGSIAGRIALGVGNAFKVMTGPVGIAITLMTAAFAIWRKHQADVEKKRANETSMFGLSKKGADELGIQYTTLTDKMKAVREEQKLMADNAKAKFEAYTSAGVTGISLTIKQLKELKEQVKGTETVKVLNNLDSSQITQWATNVKAQMVAAGKSVEEANNLIYAMIEASNKAGMGVGTLTDKVFNSIQDRGSAAMFTMKTLADNFNKVGSIDSKAFASNLDTAFNSVDAMVKGLIGTKDATGNLVDESEAVAMAFEKMNNAGIKNKNITEDVLKKIQKERPELAAILNQTDTIGGMYAKWRLVLSGVNLDLKNLTSAQAEMIAQFQSGLDAAAATATQTGNRLSGIPNVANVLEQINKAQLAASKKAQAAASGELGVNKELLKTYQDQIKKIRERADAKKKALQDSLNSENKELELQKLQLDYQSALARGDKDAALQAQLAIRQLTKQYETQRAMDKIDENAKKEEEAVQSKIDKENAKSDTIKKTAPANQKLADNLAASAASINNFVSRYTTLGNQLAQANLLSGASKDQAISTVKNDFSVFMKELVDSANKDPKVAKAFENLLTKDAKTGKFKAAEDKTYRFPKQGEVTMGGAFSQLQNLSESMTTFSLNLMGGKDGTITNVIKTLREGFKLGTKDANAKTKVSITPVTTTVGGTKKTVNYANPYDLYQDNISTSVGTEFTDKTGKKWKISGPASASTGYQIPVEKKARGGYIRHYGMGSFGGVQGPGTGTSDSIPAMLSKGEYVLNAAAVSNFGIPMLDQMNSAYNIPTRTFVNPSGFASNSYNNNTYNIDIQLNGTNVTADDIMRRFKAELALVNAREGRSRSIGGQV